MRLQAPAGARPRCDRRPSPPGVAGPARGSRDRRRRRRLPGVGRARCGHDGRLLHPDRRRPLRLRARSGDQRAVRRLRDGRNPAHGAQSGGLPGRGPWPRAARRDPARRLRRGGRGWSRDRRRPLHRRRRAQVRAGGDRDRAPRSGVAELHGARGRRPLPHQARGQRGGLHGREAWPGLARDRRGSARRDDHAQPRRRRPGAGRRTQRDDRRDRVRTAGAPPRTVRGERRGGRAVRRGRPGDRGRTRPPALRRAPHRRGHPPQP